MKSSMFSLPNSPKRKASRGSSKICRAFSLPDLRRVSWAFFNMGSPVFPIFKLSLCFSAPRFSKGKGSFISSLSSMVPGSMKSNQASMSAADSGKKPLKSALIWGKSRSTTSQSGVIQRQSAWSHSAVFSSPRSSRMVKSIPTFSVD